MMIKKRPYNFSAGPAMLPEAILKQAQDELLDWHGLGMSVMEVGHRTSNFKSLMEEVESDLRELLAIPSHYHILFLGGSARTQFAMIPMNLLSEGEQGAYLISGLWSSMAYQEGDKLKRVTCVGNSNESDYTDVPLISNLKLPSNAAYLYYTPNETVNGVRYPLIPSYKSVPLIADMTSCLLTEPIPIPDYGLIFAGAQKNISAAGLTLVIIRDDLLKSVDEPIPTMLDYKTHIENQSIYATPPSFNCYLAGKMFKWIKDQGGIDAIYKNNQKKASLLYEYIDESEFYHNKVHPDARSLVNVCFSINRNLEAEFIKQAEKCGLLALQGHRTAGGIRASLYNSMPMEGVQSLIDFMHVFYKENR